jgi:hypothetical protein
MNILKRYESDDFDESYAYDDADYVEEEGSSKPFLVKAIAMILAVTGIAYGANIALTPNGGSSVEFGQGFVTTTACDTNNGITVTPYAGFINDAGTGKFSLDAINLDKIDAACVGMDFTIQVWGDSATALTTSESATGVSTYQQHDVARFWFKDSATVVNLDGNYIDYELQTDIDTGSTEHTDNLNQWTIVFDPDRVLSFADATAVRRITIQTTKHQS